MKHLHPLFEILEVPIYVLVIGILTFETNITLSILLIMISLFRLWINVTFKE
jgi:hypothetical protein